MIWQGCFVCGVSNFALAKLFKVETNIESVWISVFILTLILSPITSVDDLWGFVEGVP
jgi:hypothetical protein